MLSGRAHALQCVGLALAPEEHVVNAKIVHKRRRQQEHLALLALLPFNDLSPGEIYNFSMTIREQGERAGMILETPLEASQGMEQERVIIEGREFVISRPAQSDTLLDHPAVRARFSDGEYLPYWVDLWPSARMLSKVILREIWTSGSRALEI